MAVGPALAGLAAQTPADLAGRGRDHRHAGFFRAGLASPADTQPGSASAGLAATARHPVAGTLGFGGGGGPAVAEADPAGGPGHRPADLGRPAGLHQPRPGGWQKAEWN